MLVILCGRLLSFDDVSVLPELVNGTAEAMADAPGQFLGHMPVVVRENGQQLLSLAEARGNVAKNGHR